MIEFKISRESDDPLCTRVSMGGNINRALYCVYRFGPGCETREDLIKLITSILEELKKGREDGTFGMGAS